MFFYPLPTPPSLPCSLSFSNLGLTFLLCRLAGARSVDFSCAAVVSSLAACLSMVAFLKSFQHARGSPRARRIPASSAPPKPLQRWVWSLTQTRTSASAWAKKKKKANQKKKKCTSAEPQFADGGDSPAKKKKKPRATRTRHMLLHYHARYLLPYRIAVNPVKKLCGERK